MSDVITISKEEYEKLLKDSQFLQCLEACGVDNWNGYSDAWNMVDEEDKQ